MYVYLLTRVISRTSLVAKTSGQRRRSKTRSWPMMGFGSVSWAFVVIVKASSGPRYVVSYRPQLPVDKVRVVLSSSIPSSIADVLLASARLVLTSSIKHLLHLNLTYLPTITPSPSIHTTLWTSPFLFPSQLIAGVRVSLDMTTLTIMRILPREVDPMVYSMSLEDPGGASFAGIGGLGEQVRELREVIELPLLNPELFTVRNTYLSCVISVWL
jgi:hypothetical protein